MSRTTIYEGTNHRIRLRVGLIYYTGDSLEVNVLILVLRPETLVEKLEGIFSTSL